MTNALGLPAFARHLASEHAAVCPDWAPPHPRATFLALALAGEAGELANNYKKEWRDGASHELHLKILAELADVGAYWLMLCEELEVNGLALAAEAMLNTEDRPGYKALVAKARERAAAASQRPLPLPLMMQGN